MNITQVNTKEKLIINIDFKLKKEDGNSNLKKLEENLIKFNLDINSENYYKKSKGRKKWKKESIEILEKCLLLFGENLTLAKLFLPEYNLNQIYNKFQSIKLNNNCSNNNLIKNNNLKNNFSKFKKNKINEKINEQENKYDINKMIESFGSLNISTNTFLRKKTGETLKEFNIDNFVQNNKVKFEYKCEVFPSIQNIVDKEDINRIKSIKFSSTNNTFQSFNDINMDKEIYSIFHNYKNM